MLMIVLMIMAVFACAAVQGLCNVVVSVNDDMCPLPSTTPSVAPPVSHCIIKCIGPCWLLHCGKDCKRAPEICYMPLPTGVMLCMTHHGLQATLGVPDRHACHIAGAQIYPYLVWCFFMEAENAPAAGPVFASLLHPDFPWDPCICRWAGKVSIRHRPALC